MARLPGPVRGWEVVDTALPKFGPAGERLATVVSAHDAVLDVDAPLAEADGHDVVCSLVRALVDALGARIDRAVCSVLTGPRHVLIRGDGDAAAQACVVRLAALSDPEFRAHWLHRHAPLAGAVSGASGYEQLHADAAGGSALGARLGFGGPLFDGIGRLLFPTPQAMYAARATDEVRAVATADEMRFIDHSHSQVTALRRIAPVVI